MMMWMAALILAQAEWDRHPGAALRKAAQRKLQILMVLGSKNCSWCRKLQEETLRHPSARSWLETRVLVYVDIDAAEDTAQLLGVSSVPDIRVFSPDGAGVARQNGYLSMDDLKAWLKGVGSEADPDLPSLAGLRPDPALDPYFILEAEGKTPTREAFEALLFLSAGPEGETRSEARRLVKIWSAPMIGDLSESLTHPRLKIRLAAFEALSDLGAPLEDFDPYAPPKTPPVEFAEWLKHRPAAPPPDLQETVRALEGERFAAARERLIAVGSAAVVPLRERSRGLRPTLPAVASRMDEVRFRILLPPNLVRRHPDAAERLASSAPGVRSQVLEELLKSRSSDLASLVREAVCDPDPLFRETALPAARAILGKEAQALLATLLQDPVVNVRTTALKELAGIPSKKTAEVLSHYLASEKDPDLSALAVKSLTEVKTKAALDVLRGQLKSKHWQVRVAAVKALGELRDPGAISELLNLLDDPDAFVTSETIDALPRLLERASEGDAAGIVEALEKVTVRRSELVPSVLKALGYGPLRKSKKTDALIRKFARHAEASVRAAALEALAEDEQRPAFKELRAGLDDPDPVVRAAAAAGLRELIESEAIHELIKKRDIPAAYAECRPLLQSMMASGGPPLLELQCALTLIYFGDDGRAALLKHLAGNDPQLREKAVRGLRWLVPEALLEEAVLACWDKAAPEEREDILYALGRAERGQKATDLLLRLFPRVPSELRSIWSSALVENFRDWSYGALYAKKSAELCRRILEASRTLTAPKDRADLEALALSHDPDRPDEEIRKLLGHEEAVVRRMALATMLRRRAKLTPAEVEPLADDREPSVRALAMVACMPRGAGYFNDEQYDWIGGRQVRRYSSTSERPRKIAVLPLSEEILRRRLADEISDVRIRAAVLMCMEGSEEALDALHRIWREKSTRDNRELLVQAVVWCWEDRWTPLLEEILESFEDDEAYDRREFLHGIAGLRGKQVRQFFSRIMTEVPR
jgi:HEAT repeat protein